MKSELTLIVGIPGEPFPFRAVGGSNDADRVAALDGQVMLTHFTGNRYFGVVHGLFISSHLQGK